MTNIENEVTIFDLYEQPTPFSHRYPPGEAGAKP